MKRRERILRNYEQRCHICGQLIDGQFDLDHVIPRARGGDDRSLNLAPAHASCNRRKQDEVAHAPELQFSLFGERRTGKETNIRPSAVANLDGECESWILGEIVHDPSSGMPTRFHHWLVDRLGQPLTYTQTQQKFLDVCKVVGVHAIPTYEGFTFVRRETEG